ncbi:hypothetical protein [Rhizobium laguerreae]|uniref:hypothetical protein n=1 Tax=Rhizobium laguerreae TaxID=1076926 RepID=UPI00406BB548
MKNTLDVEFSDLEFFRRVLSVPDQDPLMYGSYKIDKISIVKFSASMDLCWMSTDTIAMRDIGKFRSG